MTTKRLAALQVALLIGLGVVFLLPDGVKVRPSAVSLSLPEWVGSWYGTDKEVTQAERDSLGPDTQFARKLYVSGRGDEVYVSIVLSGPDMNTSIHRPERCLPAQGLTIADSDKVSFETPQGPLEAMRLHNMQNARTQNGETKTVYSLNYYWFVGSEDVTPSHLERTWIDIRDRVAKGSNQQWAYVTVTALITKDFRVFGRDEKETDELIQDFIAQLTPKLRRDTLASRD